MLGSSKASEMPVSVAGTIELRHGRRERRRQQKTGISSWATAEIDTIPRQVLNRVGAALLVTVVSCTSGPVSSYSESPSVGTPIEREPVAAVHDIEATMWALTTTGGLYRMQGQGHWTRSAQLPGQLIHGLRDFWSRTTWVIRGEWPPTDDSSESLLLVAIPRSLQPTGTSNWRSAGTLGRRGPSSDTPAISRQLHWINVASCLWLTAQGSRCWIRGGARFLTCLTTTHMQFFQNQRGLLSWLTTPALRFGTECLRPRFRSQD